MPLAQDDFRGQILRGAAECIRFVAALLGEPEVRQLEVASVGNEDVLGLQVATRRR